MPATMNMAASILPSFDQVIAGTRKHLESIPDDRLGWRPHPKSYTIGELGSHLANLPNWTVVTLEQDSFDVAPPGEEQPRAEVLESSAAMVAALDESAAKARAVIENTSDEAFMGTWSLIAGGEEKFTLPKMAVVRLFVLDHMIHHRGQLTVYLRLLDVPVQQTFGPTADFPDM